MSRFYEETEAAILPVWLDQRARLTPDRPAFETEEGQLTFAELNRSVRKLAANLAAAGIRFSDQVAILQENTLNLVQTYHALSYLGAVCVPLNRRLTAEELSFQLKDSQSGFLIADASDYEKARQAAADTGCRILGIEALMERAAAPASDYPLRRELRLDEPFTIIYTSGTTGKPKGVVLTYGNHWWNANASLINLGLRSEDKWLCCVPLFHVSGLSILIKNVIYGMPVYLCRHFDPQQCNTLISEKKISHISLVAPMLQKMLDQPDAAAFPPAFRCVLLGGGPVPPILSERCLKRQIPVYQTYGMTETASQCVTLPPEYMIEKAGSAGKPLFPLQIRILAGKVPARPGEPGEILVQGPTVFRRYLNREDATRQARAGGWYRTGDIGYLDDDGFLYVLDRRKDLIISGGENVYPAEVEATLRTFSGVTGAGVIGVPDPVWGQVPVAFICMNDPDRFSEAELISYCRTHLAGFKTPKHILLIDELPENAAHKILRRKLRSLWISKHPLNE